jgi:hypothetical protein
VSGIRTRHALHVLLLGAALGVVLYLGYLALGMLP